MKTIVSILSLLVTMGIAWGDYPASEPSLTRIIAINGENILANSFSQTLYVFDLDKEPGVSTCLGTCAEKWPPFLVTEQEAKTLQGSLSVLTRANGLLQVMLSGRPLYTFYLDRASGDLKGNGLGNVWHVAKVN